MQEATDRTLSERTGRFVSDESGATAVEYGVMVAGIAAVLVGVVISIGGSVHDDLFLKIDGLLNTLPF